MSEHHPIDLRSDTVTRPTPAMRRAMAEAEVGDDVYREDPTVNRLEERAAEIFHREAGLFVPSGTMGNAIGIKLHTEPGQEILCDTRAHVVNYEFSGVAWFSGCLARTIPTEDGILTWSELRAHVRPPHAHFAPTTVVELENTHNMAGGSVYPPEIFDEICDGAHELGLKVHLDGARIFNAAASLNRPVHELTAKADTVMFCLSKALGAPVGSLLVGAAETMARARLYRKRLGGGMRQAGVLAAAGLVALEETPPRLCEDHDNARRLAAALAALPGVTVPHRVQTNIVVFDVAGTGLTGADFSARLKQRGVLINPIAGTRLRLVTHYDVTREGCEQAAIRLAEVARHE